MDVALVAVIMSLSVPLAIIYVWFRVRQLRTQERLAAIEKGMTVPQMEELPPHARSRRNGILFLAGGLGYALMMWVIGHAAGEADAIAATAFGILPVALGIGYFIDAALVRRELRATH